MELWLDRLEGAGRRDRQCAHSLFRLLEMLDGGHRVPAAILGVPVGFVGAAESKEALIANSRGIPFIAVRDEWAEVAIDRRCRERLGAGRL